VLKVLIAAFVTDRYPDRRADARTLTGRYNIADRKRLHSNEREFFACRADHITPHMMSLTVPVIGGIGELITVQFDDLGELRGRITRHMDRGFQLDIKASAEERRQLADKLDWLARNKRQEAQDARGHRRSIPREPLSTLVLADGNTPRCFVMDMSVFGASVSAQIVPEIGTPVAVGTIIGRVARHMTEGFAIRFIEQQDPDHLERRLIKPRLHR
jgi:hypothetical protein